MQVTIRPATLTDRPIIDQATRATFDEHRVRQPYAFPEGLWDAVSETRYGQAFRTANGKVCDESDTLFVATSDGDLVGHILLSWNLRSDVLLAKSGAIDDIWVHPDWRRRGVARQLIEFVKGKADSENWDNLTATAWTGSPSTDLFEAAGFAPQSTTWRYGPDRPAPPLAAGLSAGNVKANLWKWRLGVVVALILIAVLVQI